MTKHTVTFRNCSNNWSNALPLGNGVMGAMVFFEDGILYLPVNHYEVYYHRSPDTLPQDKTFTPPNKSGAEMQDEFVKLANENIPPEGEPFIRYGKKRNQMQNEYAVGSFTNSHPTTGELRFHFSPILNGGNSELTLDVEQATVHFSLEKNGFSLKLDIITAREDCILLRITEKKPDGIPSLLEAVELTHPVCRDLTPPEIAFDIPDEKTVSYNVHTVFSNKKGETTGKFEFAGALRAKSATLNAQTKDRSATVTVMPQSDTYELIFAIFTEWRYKELPCADTLKKYEYTEALFRTHRQYWNEFHSRANLSIPDKFLEKIWYINQYALDCCSGRDGIMKHHACGLNGLWDIRHPNLWGSLWYWDVNIQAAFAGVFSSNRTELGKVFSDGLHCYEALATQFAKGMHGVSGISMDYPYTNYYCVWPWCAAYLWHQYEYTMDETYLRDDAYPLFLKLCEFAVGIFRWDDARNCYTVYPDISPEQGPYAHNTVSTVASVKYMLSFTMKAANILHDKDPLLEKIRDLYEHLPQYPICEDTTYGRRFKDSEDAPDNLWIRHPGMLMPVFPSEEFDLDRDEAMRKTVSNTIDYLEDNCEIGVFQCSWLSAASSRLGDGQRAIRFLYERGIDHMLRSNGLTAEATERFMNFCLIMRQPLYYPCMMEFTGEMLAAVNEMLLQSHRGVIRVFPAMPDGSMEYDRMLRHGHGADEFVDRHGKYEAWRDVKFTNMLAKGAFEVSAELKNGKVAWVEIHSRAGGTAKVATPHGFAEYRVFCEDQEIIADNTNEILSFKTEQGKRYVIKAEAETVVTPIETACDNDVMVHTTHTKRRIFIGEDANTACIKAFDDFIRPWYLGNAEHDNHTVYKFDFTEESQKDYSAAMPRQAFVAERGIRLLALPFVPVNQTIFSDLRGYGFREENGLQMESSPHGDILFDDCVTGDLDNEFILELPRGRYEALIVSGSDTYPTVTKVETENGYRTGGAVIPAGNYAAYTIPICAERDGKVRIRIASENGYRWRMCTLFLNIVKGYGF